MSEPASLPTAEGPAAPADSRADTPADTESAPASRVIYERAQALKLATGRPLKVIFGDIATEMDKTPQQVSALYYYHQSRHGRPGHGADGTRGATARSRGRTATRPSARTLATRLRALSVEAGLLADEVAGMEGEHQRLLEMLNDAFGSSGASR